MGMTRTEFSILVKGMKAMYSDTSFIADKDAFDLWYSLLDDLSYDQVSFAIKKHMQTSVYVPKVADIRRLCSQKAMGDEMTAQEAVYLIDKAVKGIPSEGDPNCKDFCMQKYNDMPKPIQRLLCSPDKIRELAYHTGVQDYDIQLKQYVKTYPSVIELVANDIASKPMNDARDRITQVRQEAIGGRYGDKQ